MKFSTKLSDLLLRPQLDIESIKKIDPRFEAEIEKINGQKDEIVEATEILIKYSGYIDREKMIAEKLHRLEDIKIKGKIDYNSVSSISTEARQKLIRINPETIGQASRIPGISPNDINILLVLLGR